jgi:tripartite-type tricarboxylate transporter receptor subunit TctC
MNIIRRAMLLSFAAALGLVAGTPARANDFPSRPIRIIVAFTPGTGSDLLMRNIVPELSKLLGTSVIVENRAGAGGLIGTEAGARAPADGYTLTVASSGAMLIVPTMSPTTATYRYERDFVAVGGLARSAFVVVTADTPEAPKTFQELVARAKAAGTVNFASPGVGTATHLAGEIILRNAGVKGANVAYRGSAQALNDVASGQVLFGFDTTGATLPLVKGNKLRALAVSSANRVASLPDTPTLSEAGVKDFSIAGWWGLFAPKATPPDVVAKISDALVKALNDPEVKKRLAVQEVEPFPIAARDFAALVTREEPLWSNMVIEANLVQK